MKTGQAVNRNSKHIRATPVTAKQYLRNQITKNTADPMDMILKQYGKLTEENVTSNHESQLREDTYMNNNNDTQHSNMPEHK